MKLIHGITKAVIIASPPSRGAWIEMQTLPIVDRVDDGRPPRGGRGLKCVIPVNGHIAPVSPPSRGAWIEITGSRRTMDEYMSPPSRGAWIEI